MPSPLKDLAYILSVGNDRFGFNLFADYLTNFLPFWIAMPLKLELTR